jgi:hypothetical protein
VKDAENAGTVLGSNPLATHTEEYASANGGGVFTFTDSPCARSRVDLRNTTFRLCSRTDGDVVADLSPLVAVHEDSFDLFSVAGITLHQTINFHLIRRNSQSPRSLADKFRGHRYHEERVLSSNDGTHLQIACSSDSVRQRPSRESLEAPRTPGIGSISRWWTDSHDQCWSGHRHDNITARCNSDSE